MNERFVSLLTGVSAALVVALLAARSQVVPQVAFVERQWDARNAEGPPLRESRTRWARIVSATDATLALPGGVEVQWRGFLPMERAGRLGIVFESAGATTVAIDGAVIAQTSGNEDVRGQGVADVGAGARELVVRVTAPEHRASFRAVLRLPDGRNVPLEHAEITTEPRTTQQLRAAGDFRKWADPLLALAAAITAFGLVRTLRRRDEAARHFGELVATALVFAAAVFLPHGEGVPFWGTWPWGVLPPVPRVLVLLAGLVPWFLVRTGRSLPLPRRLLTPGLAAVLAFAIFWFLRERRFWGDSWITLAILEGRSPLEPFGPFFWKEPLDRLIAVWATHLAGPWGAANAIAVTSCVAGAAAVAALAWHARERDDSGATAATVLTAGATLVFFGHVENYSWVSAAILAFLLVAPRAVRGAASPLMAGAFGGLAVAFHPVAAFVVLPALLAMALALRGSAALVLAAGAALPPALLLVACGVAGIAWPDVGFNRYADDPAVLLSLGTAFARENLLNVASRLTLLLSPGILLALLAGVGRRPSRESWPLVAAALGSLVCIVFFHGKIRPAVQDWDLYAPAAFPIALLAARALRGAEAASTRAWCAGISAAVLLLAVLGNR